MPAPHAVLDPVLFAFIALATPLVNWLWMFPRLVRATSAGVPGARGRFYLVGVLWAWGTTLCVLALWAFQGRPWSGLGLSLGTPWRFGIGLALAVFYLILMGAQRRALLARPERLERLYRGMGSGQLLLPQAPGERKGFALLAITAGICEEILFRGFVMWYVGVWTGPIFAVVIELHPLRLRAPLHGSFARPPHRHRRPDLRPHRPRLGLALAGDPHPCSHGPGCRRSWVSCAEQFCHRRSRAGPAGGGSMRAKKWHMNLKWIPTRWAIRRGITRWTICTVPSRLCRQLPWISGLSLCS